MANKDFVVKNGISASNGSFSANSTGVYSTGSVNAVSVSVNSISTNTVSATTVNTVSLGVNNAVTANSVSAYSVTVNAVTTNTVSSTTISSTGAITQNGNQVLHAGNFTSYAPNTSGGSATGTWGISISGTANNATNLGGTTSGSYRLVSAGQVIPSGTICLFQQTAAPTGFTKLTTHDDKALRVVSGSVSSGGSVAFSTAFASQSVSGSVGYTTLSESQIPSHYHSIHIRGNTAGYGGDVAVGAPDSDFGNSGATNYTGGGGSHAHSFTGTAINMAVNYVDIIFAQAN